VGTITERNGRFTAQIRIKRRGKTVFTQAQTFDRRPAANAWLKKRETELAEPGALERLNGPDPSLSEVIDLVLKTVKDGTTKWRCLTTIKSYHLANLKCSEIGSAEIAAFANEIATDRGVKPQTVENYLAHLSPVFTVAKPLWKYPLDPRAMADARIALKQIDAISASKQRDRRPTLEELDTILTWLGIRKYVRKASPPMQKVVLFAMFSTRRQEEIVKVRWSDLDVDGSRILVRDMKDPEEKDGNNVWCELPSEALKIIQSMPRIDERIFPYSTDAVGSAFTRACKMQGIENLHFHDLRHEGISRLFEMGRTIPQVASVSGHRSWKSLQRYSHLRQTGDKYADWPWLAVVTGKASEAISARDLIPAAAGLGT
jgi:integrase